MILILLLTCCTTLKDSYIPPIDIPSFPDPINADGIKIVTYDEGTSTVTMPLWYWKQITKYALKVEEARNIWDSYMLETKEAK